MPWACPIISRVARAAWSWVALRSSSSWAVAVVKARSAEGGEQEAAAAVDHPERTRIAGVEVEGGGSTVEVEGQGQDAPHPVVHGPWGEDRPAGVAVELLDVDDACPGQGVEARSFGRLVLKGIHLDDHGIGRHRRGHGLSLPDEDAGEVTALDGGYREHDHLIERILDGVGGEEADRLGHCGREVRSRVACGTWEHLVA